MQEKIPHITVHGRFQPPLHVNHWKYVATAFEFAEHVTILITNPKQSETAVVEASHRHQKENNPFSYEERVRIFRSFFQRLNILETRYDFKPFDIVDESMWKEVLDPSVPNLVNVYSEWSEKKLQKFQDRGYRVILTRQAKTLDISGSHVRKILTEDLSWEKRRRVLIEVGFQKEAIEGLFDVLFELKGQGPIAITSYIDPDLDGFACIMAYTEYFQKIGQEARAAISGVPHEEVKFLMEKFGFVYPEPIENLKGQKIILVDASEIQHLQSYMDPNAVIEVIDHRKVHDAHLFPNARIQIEMVGAAATLIAEKFWARDFVPSPESAMLLYGAIVSNTLNFQARVTTERDRSMAKWLASCIEIPSDFIETMFTAKSDVTGPKLAQRIESDFGWFMIGDKKIGIGQMEMYGGLEIAQTRTQEIFQELAQQKVEAHLDHTFLSIVDIRGNQNIFVTEDSEMVGLLESIFSIHFTQGVAIRSGLILRKEIAPLLKEKLEK